MRKTPLVNGEYYHIFNRGTDKRITFPDRAALARFFQSMNEFNTIEPVGSIYENSFCKSQKNRFGNPVSKFRQRVFGEGKLVEFICYCLNPNHYHFIVRQVYDKGIEKFMHRLGLGYTKYFNHRFARSGVLFQGPFKAIHIDSNEYLLYLSAYVNLNNHVHRLGNGVSKSSWDEYVGGKDGFYCDKRIIQDQFKNSSEYKQFAKEALMVIRGKRDMEELLLE